MITLGLGTRILFKKYMFPLIQNWQISNQITLSIHRDTKCNHVRFSVIRKWLISNRVIYHRKRMETLNHLASSINIINSPYSNFTRASYINAYTCSRCKFSIFNLEYEIQENKMLRSRKIRWRPYKPIPDARPLSTNIKTRKVKTVL